MLRSTLAAALFVLPAAAFAQPTTTTDPAPAPVRYVDALDWPTRDAGTASFGEAEDRLNMAFDRLCGDTFCEGDYSNLTPLQLSCSVDATKATLKQCLWVFAGSHASVNPKSGAVQATAKLFKCKLLLAKDTPVDAFYEVMTGGDPLNDKLPMTNHSVYDGLLGCLW
ncbi:hypothetical protein IM816_01480 [Luteibacter flocculans]|uniref:Uncharacterized protein n=1 Tax=Luteibacter flocculans TaxID=2780091 RepID=A0ABY4T1K3_9GAMM|nr:hypothetical protein [Luteibacter flocculans]URL58823.1 hypothetical protein IM816_01480 [Luteibacter flocculans]